MGQGMFAGKGQGINNGGDFMEQWYTHDPMVFAGPLQGILESMGIDTPTGKHWKRAMTNDPNPYQQTDYSAYRNILGG